MTFGTLLTIVVWTALGELSIGSTIAEIASFAWLTLRILERRVHTRWTLHARVCNAIFRIVLDEAASRTELTNLAATTIFRGYRAEYPTFAPLGLLGSPRASIVVWTRNPLVIRRYVTVITTFNSKVCCSPLRAVCAILACLFVSTTPFRL